MMAERDDKKTLNPSKNNNYEGKRRTVGAKISIDMYNDFISKLNLDGLSINSMIHKWIEEYTYGSDKK